MSEVDYNTNNAKKYTSGPFNVPDEYNSAGRAAVRQNMANLLTKLRSGIHVNYGETLKHKREALRLLERAFMDAGRESSHGSAMGKKAAMANSDLGAAQMQQSMAASGITGPGFSEALQAGAFSDAARINSQIDANLSGLLAQLQGAKGESMARGRTALANVHANKNVQAINWGQGVMPLLTKKKKSKDNSGLMSLAGTVIGGYFGGPAGASFGNQIGGAAGAASSGSSF